MSRKSPSHRDRLWTPWRMRYVGGDQQEERCLFCNRLAREDDIASLILHRADTCFVIMNLFPYNTGHLMIVPNRHVAEIDQVEPSALAEMACLLPPITRALRRVLGCDGFNIGFNQGAVAGAGIADHLHQHVVPRWEGDANFMPILAGTMVIPELIPSSYAKIRAELDSEIHKVTRFEVVLLDDRDDPSVWLECETIPTVSIVSTSAVWRAAIQELDLQDAEFVGYSGAFNTNDRAITPGLVIRTSTVLGDADWQRTPLFDNNDNHPADHPTRKTLDRVRSSLRPWIGSANVENPLDSGESP